MLISLTHELEAVLFSVPSVFILHCEGNIPSFAYAFVYLSMFMHICACHWEMAINIETHAK